VLDHPAAVVVAGAVVEMLTVWLRSPPVPTTSTQGPGTSIRTAWASIEPTSPESSATVSPLLRNPIRNPASRLGVISPCITWSIAQAA
jgi:hypothetical protein